MKKLKIVLTGLCLAVAAMAAPVFAADVAVMLPEGSPEWVAAVLAFYWMVCGVAARLDAHIPEPFKRRFPWWIQFAWNYLAGNYKHSKNQPFKDVGHAVQTGSSKEIRRFKVSQETE